MSDRLLKAGLGLELMDHVVQSVLMQGVYRQELQADAGTGSGPAGAVMHPILLFL